MSIFRKFHKLGLNLDQDFKNKFIEKHKQNLLKTYKPGDVFPRTNYESYILQNNGDIDHLLNHHSPHMQKTVEQLPYDLRDYDNNIEDVNGNKLGTYEKIHHYFNGGIRIYMASSRLYMSAYQIPNEQQLIALDNLVKHVHPESINIDLYLKQPKHANDPNDPFYTGETNVFYFDSSNWQDVKQWIKSLTSQFNTPSTEVLQRIQKLQSFRTPEFSQEKAIIPDSIYKGNNFTQKELEKFKQFTPSIVEKQQKTIGANVLKNLLKYAEILDNQNEYIKSDMIINFIKEAIASEEIDWSQPNAYIMYMDAIKSKSATPVLEEIKTDKKNPTLRRLQNGFYNDLLIADLAKLAESLGFEVVANGQHFKFTDKTGKLRTSPNEKYKSGTILIGGHKKNNQGVADYLGAKEFAAALKYLGYI